MREAGNKKHKNHHVLIHRAVQAYTDMLKDEISDLSDDQESLDARTIDSEELEEDYNFVMMLKEA